MKNKILKNNALVIAVIACFCALAVIGTSYAFFFGVKSNTNNQVIKTGALKVSYSNSGSINATSLYPTSDEYALNPSNNDVYEQTFNVQNEGTLKSSYSLNLNTDNGNNMNLDYVKVALFKMNQDDQYELVSGPSIITDFRKKNNTTYILNNGSLDVESGEDASSSSYKIRVWLDIDAPNDVIGKNLKLNINIESLVDEQSEVNKLIETE